MKQENKYSSNNTLDKPNIEDVFSNIDMTWDKSKDDIWRDLSSEISKNDEKTSVYFSKIFLLRISITTVILIILILFLL